MIIRSESRTVRPFEGLSLAEEIFSRTVLLIDNKEHESGSLLIPGSQVKTGNFALKTNTDLSELQKACDDAGVPHESARYVIYARSRMLRKSTIIYDHPLNRKDFLDTVEIDRMNEDKLVFGDQSGFEISSALIVWDVLEKKPLKVSEPGTWLGRSRFKIRPESDFSSFSPLHLDKLTRERLRLREGTYSHIEIQDDILVIEDLSDGVQVYLDEDVLNLLLQDETDGMAKAIQTQLAVTTISSITQFIAQELKSENLILEDLGEDIGANRFIRKLASDAKIAPEDLLDMALTKSNHLVSLVESRFNLSNAIERLLKEN
jgi:hypothetical protein